jgi:hypothetical protein
MATFRFLSPANPTTTTISSPSSVTTFSISGNGTVSSPYSGASTNQGLHNTTANATFSIGGTGTATIQYNVTISSEQGFDFGRILKNGVQELNVSGVTTTHIGSFLVSSGDTVQVQYFKDGSVNSNNDVFTINSLYIADPPTVKFLGASTFRFIDPLPQTANPNIPSFSMSNCITNFGTALCTYSWTVRNNDALTATVDSGPSSPPSYDSRSVNSNTTSSTITQTSVESFNDGQNAFGSVFARATASGKTASTIVREDTSTLI